MGLESLSLRGGMSPEGALWSSRFPAFQRGGIPMASSLAAHGESGNQFIEAKGENHFRLSSLEFAPSAVV